MEETLLLDPCYAEDSQADVDINVVRTGGGRFVEIQGTAEKAPFSREELDAMVGLASQGIERLLLAELEGVPEERRTARFVSCAALAAPGREIVVTRGEVRGRIAPEPRGEGGFGYDPVFFHPGHGRTLAEVAPEEKDAVSHRRRSLEALRPHLERLPQALEKT